MNIEILREKSLRLRACLDELKTKDSMAMKLSLELKPLINAAKHGQIRTPMEWRDIPGRDLFTEEGLQQYADLENAFAAFRIELTGGESPTLRRLKQKMGEVPQSE